MPSPCARTSEKPARNRKVDAIARAGIKDPDTSAYTFAYFGEVAGREIDRAAARKELTQQLEQLVGEEPGGGADRQLVRRRRQRGEELGRRRRHRQRGRQALGNAGGVMHRIVCLERDSVIAEFRRPAFPHDWIEYPKSTPAQVIERLQGATIAIVNKLPLPAAAVDALKSLKMVAVSATGTNIVDLDACRQRGIVVSNIRGYADQTVPEHALALLLALSRNLIAWRATVQAGRWQQSEQFCLFDHPIRDLHGATLGLIGSGSLGNGVARLAEAFGMRVLRAERKGASALRPGYTAFHDVLHQADAISLHCPLTPRRAGTRRAAGSPGPPQRPPAWPLPWRPRRCTACWTWPTSSCFSC